jgi:hypothetical protein
MRAVWVTPCHSRTSRVPGLKEIGGAGLAAAERIRGRSLQLPCGGHGEAAVCPLLKLVSDPSDQEVAGPSSAQLENPESRTSTFAISIAALSMSANAPRLDAVAANAVVGLR